MFERIVVSDQNWCPTNLRDSNDVNRRRPKRENGYWNLWCPIAR